MSKMDQSLNHIQKRAGQSAFNTYNGRYCSTLQNPKDYIDSSSAELQDLHLNGPNDILWIVDVNLRLSAYSLQPPQLRTAIQICFDCKANEEHLHYGYWLTRVYKDLVGKPPAECVHFTIANPSRITPDRWCRVIEKHQAFLQFIGDLQELVTRCRENAYKLTGLVRGDVRDCKPLEIKKQMYKVGVPGTNYVNVYRHRFRLNQTVEACYVELWRNQNDPQIIELNRELGIV